MLIKMNSNCPKLVDCCLMLGGTPVPFFLGNMLMNQQQNSREITNESAIHSLERSQAANIHAWNTSEHHAGDIMDINGQSLTGYHKA